MSSSPLAAPRPDMLLLVRGRTVGAMICAGFGAYSMYWWMLEIHGAPALWMPLIAAVTGTLLLLSITQFVRLFRGQRLTSNKQLRRFYRIWFSVIVSTEVAAIILGGPILTHVQRSNLYPIWVDCVVGLHFFPLGRLFKLPLYYATGGAISFFAVASLLISQSSLRAAACSAGTGLALWLTASLVLYKNLSYVPAENL